MKLKIALLAGAAGFLLLAVAGCGPSTPKNTLEKVTHERKLTIATHPVNPPFQFGAGTGVDGFDYDLVQAIAKEMGTDTQWFKKQFDKCFDYLRTGDVDIVINAVTITPERQEEFLFSDPYFETGQIIAIRKDREDIKNPEDLKGKRVGVQRGTTAEQFLLALGEGAVTIMPFDSFDDALFELNRTLLDAVVGDAPTILYDIRLLSNLRTVGELLTREEYGIVMRKGDIELQAEINRILSVLRENGTIDALVEKWQLNKPLDVEPEPAGRR